MEHQFVIPCKFFTSYELLGKRCMHMNTHIRCAFIMNLEKLRLFNINHVLCGDQVSGILHDVHRIEVSQETNTLAFIIKDPIQNIYRAFYLSAQDILGMDIDDSELIAPTLILYVKRRAGRCAIFLRTGLTLRTELFDVCSDWAPFKSYILEQLL